MWKVESVKVNIITSNLQWLNEIIEWLVKLVSAVVGNRWTLAAMVV